MKLSEKNAQGNSVLLAVVGTTSIDVGIFLTLQLHSLTTKFHNIRGLWEGNSSGVHDAAARCLRWTLEEAQHREVGMSIIEPSLILIVDDNPIFRNTLTERLHNLGYQILIAEAGEAAFIELRDWPRCVGWLYSRANLPGLIDGWILADEYHDSFSRRAAVLSSCEARKSSQGHIVLPQPTPSMVLDALRQVIESPREAVSAERLRPTAYHAAA